MTTDRDRVEAQPQTFLGERGAYAANVTIGDIYKIVFRKLEYFHPDRCDPDAFCQDICCQIEKLNGTYPNVPGLKKGGEEP
jgi:hypothetical protein